VNQQYLPETGRYYEPVDRGYEAEICRRSEDIHRRQSDERSRPAVPTEPTDAAGDSSE
jgi:hypothetical protein